jgi:hypothetical protein
MLILMVVTARLRSILEKWRLRHTGQEIWRVYTIAQPSALHGVSQPIGLRRPLR